MIEYKIRYAFGKYVVCDGAGEGFCIGTIFGWYDTWKEADAARATMA
jgi:hypothetical protein